MFVEMKGARVNPLLFPPANAWVMIVAFACVSGTRVYGTKQRSWSILWPDADRDMAETEDWYHKEQRRSEEPCGIVDGRSPVITPTVAPSSFDSRFQEGGADIRINHSSAFLPDIVVTARQVLYRPIERPVIAERGRGEVPVPFRHRETAGMSLPRISRFNTFTYRRSTVHMFDWALARSDQRYARDAMCLMSGESPCVFCADRLNVITRYQLQLNSCQLGYRIRINHSHRRLSY